MRRIFTLAFTLFMGGAVLAQGGFEGTMEYKVSLDGEKAEELSKVFPQSVTIKIKDKKMLGKNTGGDISKMFSGFIFNGESNSMFLLSPGLKMAMEIQSVPAGTASSASNIEVKKTTETTKIAGHECTKYIVEEQEGKRGKVEIWATEDFSVEKPKNLGNITGNMFLQGIDGFPLKVVTSQEGTEIKMEVHEVRKESVLEENFKIPEEYRVQPMDFSLLSTMLPGLGY